MRGRFRESNGLSGRSSRQWVLMCLQVDITLSPLIVSGAGNATSHLKVFAKYISM
jgi:hypothetical protein